MPFYKGMKKVGGRKVGSVNKITTDARELAQRLGVDPHEILLRFAANDWKGLGYKSPTYEKTTLTRGEDGKLKATKYSHPYITPEIRATCAKEAAKYVRPQLKAIEVTDTSKTGDVIRFHIGWRDEQDGAGLLPDDARTDAGAKKAP